MSKKAFVAFAATFVMASAVAVAGTTYPNSSSDAEVVMNSGGGGWLQGSLGAVRNSPDSTQYLGCYVRTLAGSDYATCYARTNTSAYGSCSTSNWRLIRAIQTVSDTTRIRASWDSSFQCTEIQIRSASTEEPRQL